MNTAHPVVAGAVRPDPHTLRIRLEGDPDYTTADEVLIAVREHVHGDREIAAIELDCAGVGFCDSHGLAVLLMTHRVAGTADVRLRMCDLGPQLLRLLKVTQPASCSASVASS